MKYNDYTSTVIRYLVKYRDQKGYLATLQIEKQGKEELLKNALLPITPSYKEGCGGGDTSSKVEEEYIRREKLEKEIRKISADIISLSTHLHRLQQALESLGRDERIIIEERWINRTPWEFIGSMVHLSPRTCRRKHDKALESLTKQLFGGEAVQDQSFLFIPSVDKSAI